MKVGIKPSVSMIAAKMIDSSGSPVNIQRTIVSMAQMKKNQSSGFTCFEPNLIASKNIKKAVKAESPTIRLPTPPPFSSCDTKTTVSSIDQVSQVITLGLVLLLNMSMK